MSKEELMDRASGLEKQLNLERVAREQLKKSNKNKTRLMLVIALAFAICFIIHVAE